MNRFDFYFKQPVSEAEFDGAFDAAEDAMWNMFKDRQIYGIINGFVPSAGGGWNISVGAGKGIDKNGARLWSSGAITQSVLTATDGSSCIPSAGNRRWVSIFARFGRDLDDPRTDGLGNPVKFVRAEALVPDVDDVDVGKLLIVKGTEDLTSNPIPVRPALDGSAILIADVLITDGDGSLLLGAIDSSRAERLVDDSKQWDFPAGGQFHGGNPKFVLLAEYPLQSGLKARFYLGSTLHITINAQWDPVAELWSLDDIGAASRVTFQVTGIYIYKRTDTGTPWTETVDSAGWDSLIKLAAPITDSYLDISAHTDIVTKGTQTVFWGFRSQGSFQYCQSVSYPKQFSATPSSVTLSTSGLTADYVSSGSISSVSVDGGGYANGAMIHAIVTDDAADVRIERNVVATY